MSAPVRGDGRDAVRIRVGGDADTKRVEWSIPDKPLDVLEERANWPARVDSRRPVECIADFGGRIDTQCLVDRRADIKRCI
jgi:hypothetical protein